MEAETKRRTRGGNGRYTTLTISRNLLRKLNVYSEYNDLDLGIVVECVLSAFVDPKLMELIDPEKLQKNFVIRFQNYEVASQAIEALNQKINGGGKNER